MRKKFFRPITIGGATTLIAFTTLLSYVFGLLRDRIIGVHFGTTSMADAYNSSFLIPDMLFNLFIAGALTAAFLPIFSEKLTTDKKEAISLANTMLTSSTILISVLALIAALFMGKLVPILFPTAEPEMQRDIINMTRIMLPSAILFAISNTLGNILMSYKHFLAYAISPILYNAGIMGGVIFFHDTLGIYSGAIGVFVGALLHCAIRVIDALTTEYTFKPNLQLFRPEFKKIITLMIPRSIGLISWQINLYIYAVVGIKLLEGSLTAFNFARNIQSFAVSLFGVSFATAIFPYLANAASTRNYTDYAHKLQLTIERTLFFTVPAAAGVMLLARPIITILFEGGSFQERSVSLTTLLLYFFAFSIPFESLVHILSRAFYAVKNTMTPMIINLIAMVVTAFCTIVLAPRYGIEWFSIGFSLGFAIQVFLMIILLKNFREHLAKKEFFISLTKTLISTALMSLAIIGMQKISLPLPQKLTYLLHILLGGMTYIAAALCLKAPELKSIRQVTARLFNK